jgi:hypothetical protein
MLHPTPRELRTLIRRHRRKRRYRPFGDTALDIYATTLGILIVGAVTAATAYDSLSDAGLPTGLGLSGTGQWLVVALTALAAGGAVRLLNDAGPVVVGQATHTWLLATPIDQRGVLLPRFMAQTTGGAIAGGIAGWVMANLLAVHPGRPAVLGAALVIGAHSATAAAQSSAGATRAVRKWLLPLLALAALAVVALVAAGRSGVRIAAPPWNGTTAMIVVSVLAIPLTAVAVVRLDRLTREALGQVDLINAAGAAIAMMDPAGLAAVVDARRWRRVGRVRSRSFRGADIVALVHADFLRQARNPSGLVWWCALLVVPHLAAVLDVQGLPSMTLATVVTAIAAGRLARGLREACGSASLRYALGISDARVRAAHLVAPAAGALVFVGICAATGVDGLTWPVSLVAVVAAVGVVYRRATMPATVWTGAALDTPFGPVPADFVQQVLRGPLLLSVAILLQFLLNPGGFA